MKNYDCEISARLLELDAQVMKDCAPCFERIEKTQFHNRQRVLRAFTDNRIAASLLGSSTGYGFGDSGRDRLDKLFADIVGAPDALCRTNFMSGTHALSVALFALLRPGDLLLCATGAPYDTLRGVIGGSGVGSLAEFGVGYEQLEMRNGAIDLAALAAAAPRAKVVHIQRSRGYAARAALSCGEIEQAAAVAKKANPNVTVMVDNCYGEFCESREPTAAGADLMAGSLIKNAGGAVAQTGGYVAGRADLVELCGHRLTAPGTGRELGSSPAGLRETYLGLYFAPCVVEQALKTSVYAARLFSLLGYETSPAFDAPRGDIVTAVRLKTPAKLIAFCEAVQARSPVDSFAAPEPWPMPGYECDIIMAAGAFTAGSSIELSCDAPLREPYDVYMQGGVHLDYSRAALLYAAQRVLTEEKK